MLMPGQTFKGLAYPHLTVVRGRLVSGAIPAAMTISQDHHGSSLPGIGCAPEFTPIVTKRGTSHSRDLLSHDGASADGRLDGA